MKFAVLALLLCVATGSVAFAAPPKPAAVSLAVTYRTLTRKKAKQYEVTAKYPFFAGTSPVVRLANTTVRAYVEKEVNDFVRESEADWKQNGVNNDSIAYSLDLTPSVSLARPNLISLHFERSTYMGGPHPNTDFPAMTFGNKNGQAKRLELRDLFRAGFTPYGGLDKYLIPQLRKREASRITEDELKSLGKDELSSWTLTPRGIEFLFAPYVVASYAEGAFDAQVTFTELRHVIAPQGPLRPLL